MAVWCRVLLGYTDKTKIGVQGTGSGGHAELVSHFADDKVLYALLRLLDGDAESRRTKFVFITWVGASVGGLARGRVTAHKVIVSNAVGQKHVEIQAEDSRDYAEANIRKRIKVRVLVNV